LELPCFASSTNEPRFVEIGEVGRGAAGEIGYRDGPIDFVGASLLKPEIRLGPGDAELVAELDEEDGVVGAFGAGGGFPAGDELLDGLRGGRRGVLGHGLGL
jgi:hypothetical protein